MACAVPVHLYGGALPPGVDVGNHIGAVVARLPLPGRDEAAHLRQVRDGVGGALRGGARAVVAYRGRSRAGASEGVGAVRCGRRRAGAVALPGGKSNFTARSC